MKTISEYSNGFGLCLICRYCYEIENWVIVID